MKEARRWWIEDNDGNRTEPADCAKHRYLEVIEAAPVEAEIERLRVKCARQSAELIEKQEEIERLRKALEVCKRQMDNYLPDHANHWETIQKAMDKEIDAILEGK